MNLKEFAKQVLLLGVLVLVSTWLSFFDKESSYYRTKKQAENPPNKQASISQASAHPTITLEKREEGGGVTEDAKESTLVQESFVLPELNPNYWPIRNWNVPEPQLDALAALVFDPATERNLYVKNVTKDLPIASITKLMTALTVLDFIPPETPVTVSKNAVSTEGEAGNLIVGEEMSVKNLLAAMLIESSNDAAVALEEYFNSTFAPQTLVEEMNKKASQLGLDATRFQTVTGLDSGSNASNLSQTPEVSRMMLEAWKHPLIQSFISMKELDVHSTNGVFNHHLTNSNSLLGRYPEILGSKTGYTEIAGESMVSLIRTPHGKNTLIAVVLNTADRERDTLTLLNWLKTAYLWE